MNSREAKEKEVADNYIFNRRGVRGALPRGRGVLDSFDFNIAIVRA
jgi:hypothetical protein